VEYPKKYMSITELVEFTGLSRDFFKQLSRAKGAPITRTVGRGKIYFRTNELDAFIKKIQERRM